MRPTTSDLRTASINTVGYRGSEALVLFYNPALAISDAVPVAYLHGFLGNAHSNRVSPGSTFLRHVVDAGFPVILADYGGPATWSSDDVVAAGNAIDDALDYANTQWGTREDQVIIAGESMGSWAAAGWAWRNVTRVAAVWLVAPIVDAVAFYNANPSLQASIAATHPGWPTGSSTYDPDDHKAELREWGINGRMRLDVAAHDELIAPAIPAAFAADTHADLYSWDTDHGGLYAAIDPGQVVAWLRERVFNRRHP